MVEQTKDVKKEEEEKKDKELQQERKPNWFQNVPAIWKIAGVAIIFLRYYQISQNGGDIKELWPWVIAVLVIWWLLGQTITKHESKILTPEEAEAAAKKEIERKKREGQYPKDMQYIINVNNGLFHNDGMPYYYTISLLFYSATEVLHRQATVIAVGDAKGYATIQEAKGYVTGRDPQNVKIVPNKDLKLAQRYGYDKLLFGDWKRQQ